MRYGCVISSHSRCLLFLISVCIPAHECERAITLVQRLAVSCSSCEPQSNRLIHHLINYLLPWHPTQMLLLIKAQL